MKALWKNIVEGLISKNYTIATMESCTGGGVANEITNISGASSIIREGYVTYCNDAKIKQGVPKEVIDQYTVYSAETAVEMAKAAKNRANSDIGVGVTGQLGRIDPNNPVDKLNCVWYAIINQNDNVIVKEVNVPSEEREIQKKIVIAEIAKTLLETIS